MKKIIKKSPFIAILLFLIIGFCNTYSQGCPPNYLNWNDPVTSQIRPYIGPLGGQLYGKVDYRSIQNPDGSYDAKIDWSTLGNYTYNKWNLTNEELKGIAYLSVISSIIAGCQSGNTLTISFYETVECKITHHCYLNANQTTKILCQDNLWPGPDPATIVGSNYEVWLILWDEQCGTKCCKKTFTVQCGSINPTHLNNYTILNVVSMDFTSCQTSTIFDCLFNTPEPCSAPCP